MDKRANAPHIAPFVTMSRAVNAILDDETHALFTQLSRKHGVSRAGLARALITIATRDPVLIDRALAFRSG